VVAASRRATAPAQDGGAGRRHRRVVNIAIFRQYYGAIGVNRIEKMDPQELKATIAAAQAGRGEAYQALLEAYWPRLYGYFVRAVGNHHDAEDLLGDMALKLVRQLTNYDDRGRFDPWLFRIAANMVRDRFRRIKVRPRTASLSVEGVDGRTMADRLPGEPEPVDASLMLAEASEGLTEAMDKLEPTTKQMVLLRHFGQMSFKEIAATFECPIGTALARVHRGLRTLRRLMGDDDGDN